MSSSESPDPRLLLPEWLRDGDLPASAAVVEIQPKPAVAVVPVVPAVADEVVQAETGTLAPFSDRLSLDTRLDPGQLVSAADLPAWLGGLEPRHPLPTIQTLGPATAAPLVSDAATVAEPAHYEGIDAQDEGVIDIQVNGWYLVAGAIGLLILLAAALRLYLS